MGVQKKQTELNPLETGGDKRHLRGFTIIELSLVLAISSLLLLLMMTGITLAVQRQRFSDSVNGTQGFIQRQFNFVQNTINNRPDSSCDPDNPGVPLGGGAAEGRGSSACLVLGKLLDIEKSAGDDESRVTAYDVIGKDVDVDDDAYRDLTDLELLSSVKPTAVKQPGSDSRYVVPWGAHISDIWDANTVSNGPEVRYIVLLRSPRTGVIHVYRIGTPIGTGNLTADATLLAQNPGNSSLKEITNGSVKMCLASVDLSNFNAMLEVIPSGSQDGVTTHFDDAAKEAYPCA